MSPQSRYTILRKIADGGTAEIFLAKQSGASGFEKMVVLKRIFNTFYSDPQFRHMLVDEAHIAMSLSHSNIVQVLDLGEADGRHFLALELVDGWTLDEVLKRTKAANVPIPPALALYVTAEVDRALAYAHSKSRDGQPLGIVHRDVSPHNVLLSEQGEVKLTDFGIAKAHNKQEQSLGNLIKGKIAFMSPEQASGHELDARSDLFSLGTILYEMIARRPPFDAPTDYETLMQVRAGDFVPPETARPGLNPEIYRVMRKAMAKAPADRYQQAGDMLVDVEQVMRVAFRAVGQTELARWLSELSAKDGVPPLTRAQPPAVSDTIVMDRPPLMTVAKMSAPPPLPGKPRPPAVPKVASGTESGLELDLDGPDATLVTAAPRDPAKPPPPPVLTAPPVLTPARPLPGVVDAPAPGAPAAAAPSTEHVTSLRPLPFWKAATFRKRATRAGGAVLLLAIAIAALQVARSHEPVTRASSVPAAAAQATPVANAPTANPPAGNEPAATAPAPAAQPMAGAASDAGRTTAAVLPDARARTELAAATPEPPTSAASREKAEEKAEEKPDEKADEKADDDDDDADTRDATNKATTKKPHISVAVKSDPDGTQVSSRHRTFGVTPISLKLRPGSYELTFTKAGYLPTTKTVLVASSTRSVHVSLKRAPAPRPMPSAEAPPPESKKGWWQRHFSR
jgi:serine/threonine-protein kinase